MTAFLQRVIGALIILVVGFLVGRIAKTVIRHELAEKNINKFLRSLGFAAVSDIAASIVEFTSYVASVLVALRYIGGRAIGAFFVFVITISTCIILLLWLRDLIPNLVQGALMRSHVMKYRGKTVTIGKVKGTIRKIGITTITLKDKERIEVPYLYLNREGIRLEKL